MEEIKQSLKDPKVINKLEEEKKRADLEDAIERFERLAALKQRNEEWKHA